VTKARSVTLKEERDEYRLSQKGLDVDHQSACCGRELAF
jgi:hypothetical protein